VAAELSTVLADGNGTVDSDLIDKNRVSEFIDKARKRGIRYVVVLRRENEQNNSATIHLYHVLSKPECKRFSARVRPVALTAGLLPFFCSCVHHHSVRRRAVAHCDGHDPRRGAHVERFFDEQ
jgi:hypothetical protein